jgi:cell division transport system permease protein
VSLLQALRYFFREALVNLVRGWKVGLLAVATIAVSLLVGGAFLLVSRNLAGSLERWRAEMRVIVYLRPEAAAADLGRLAAEAAAAPWAATVEKISPQEARRQFREIFPSLSDLVQGWDHEPLPASIAIGLRQGRPTADVAAWLDRWRRRPEVAMVDDDREWLGQLDTLLAVVRGVGLALGGGLLAAAIFTIAGIIRLTAFLHHEEIATLRLVGATEFFIRGPFYAEGLLQGLCGGGAALAALYGLFRLVHARTPEALFTAVVAGRFLSGHQMLFLLLVGAFAGLFGAVVSLRRESLE